MKLTRILPIAAALLAIAIPTPLFAKGKGKAGKGDPAKKAAHQAKAAALTQYDKNSDGAITGDESTALRAAFDADKTGPLKPLDVNSDGTLDDNEIAAIHKGKGGKGKGGKGGKKGKNKNQPAPAPTTQPATPPAA